MTETIFIALFAAAVGGLFVWIFARGQRAAILERLVSRDADVARLNDELTALRMRLAETEAEKSAVEELLSVERVTLAAERASATEKIAALNDAHTRLATEFKALSADALKTNSDTFLQIAQATLAKFQQKAEGDLTARQQAIDSLVKPLKESLEKVDVKIGELEQTRARAYGQLGQQLESLNMAQLRLQSETVKLSASLRSAAYTGSWGELQLRRVVELSDMLQHCDFVEQLSAANENGNVGDRLRADMIIRLPGGQNVVVDAKSPIQSYRDALDATDDAGRAAKMAEHAQKIRKHIDDLGSKNYWQSFQPAPEFVVMFVPGDHLLVAALQSDNTLLDRAISKRVLLATPTTLIALLKATAYGWRQEAISKNAEEISRIGRELYDRIVTFATNLEGVGESLASAIVSYNNAVGSYQGSILPGARKFEVLGAKGQKQLSEPKTIEDVRREITKRE